MRLTRAIGLPGCTAPKVLRHQFATALQEGRVDPLVRNLLMGHAAAGDAGAGHGLGMTAVYTHTRPETRAAGSSRRPSPGAPPSPSPRRGSIGRVRPMVAAGVD